MKEILTVSTLLGGAAAVWFFWDKRRVITAWFKISTKHDINPLSLGDEEFTFVFANSESLLQRSYMPINSAQEVMCKSLTNSGVLIKSGDQYRLSTAGRLMLKA